ncbi:MAG: hypothetical protein ACRDNP_16050, partial [Gaiellaceae bacterium]
GTLVLLAATDATRTSLTIVGAAFEAVGIGLVALDFWAPAADRGFRRIRSWDVRARLQRVIDWFAGRQRHAVSASLTMPWESAGNEIVEREERLRAEVQEWIARSKDQYLPWRIVGLVVALSGTVLLAAANLV